MKVASYNIHKCRGTDRRVRPDRIVSVLGEIGADLVALQEVDRRFGSRTGLLDPAAILRETGLHLLIGLLHGVHGAVGLVLDAFDQRGDLARGLGRAIRQAANRLGHDGKAASRIACSGNQALASVAGL